MSLDPDGFPFDPDPLHVDDDPNPRVPRDADNPIRDGLGCILTAVAFAIGYWALAGFPGLPR